MENKVVHEAGIFQEKWDDGMIMSVDLIHYIIRVKSQEGKVISYHFEDPITVGDIAQITDNHRKSKT